jgi:integrase
MTFKELFDKYIDNYARHNKKTWKADVAVMNRYAQKLYDYRLSTVSKDEVYKLFNKVTTNNGKVAANRMLACFSVVFNKAIEYGWQGTNPVTGVKKNKEHSRDRYITLEEIPKFFEALNLERNTQIRDFVLIALYTGARKSNVRAMRWEDISFESKTWYIEDTKNGTSQLLPLSEEALEILKDRSEGNDSRWVFPSKRSASGHLEEPKGVWARIRKNAGIKDVRLHDLRRTLGSWMANFGATQYVIGKSLNHKSPQSTAIYARLNIDPVREYMNKVSSGLNQISKQALNNSKDS